MKSLLIIPSDTQIIGLPCNRTMGSDFRCLQLSLYFLSTVCQDDQGNQEARGTLLRPRCCSRQLGRGGKGHSRVLRVPVISASQDGVSSAPGRVSWTLGASRRKDLRRVVHLLKPGRVLDAYGFTAGLRDSQCCPGWGWGWGGGGDGDGGGGGGGGCIPPCRHTPHVPKDSVYFPGLFSLIKWR